MQADLSLDPADGAWPLDRSDFLGAIGEKADLIRRGYEAGRAAAEPLSPAGLLFAGMGFSGISSNLVKDACTRALDIPFTIVKHYQFPHHVKPDWHTLAVSYSGETEETLEVTQEAVRRGVPVTSFSTGGTISGLAAAKVVQPKGYQPRAALAYAWFSLLGYLRGSGILDEEVPVDAVMEAVQAEDATCGPTVPEADNPAKQLARHLATPIPQIYATPAFYGVGLHFRGMLNENAKKIADVDLVPECNHNDLTGWGDDPNRAHFTAVALSHGAQHDQIHTRLAHMEERYRAWGVDWHHRQARPIHTVQEHIVEQARAIQFLDYVSFYTAMLRQEDPSEIREIMGLKAKLRGGA
ncbi:MAG: SIS domain-containing protein [Thermoplasmatota archaeon]